MQAQGQVVHTPGGRNKYPRPYTCRCRVDSALHAAPHCCLTYLTGFRYRLKRRRVRANGGVAWRSGAGHASLSAGANLFNCAAAECEGWSYFKGEYISVARQSGRKARRGATSYYLMRPGTRGPEGGPLAPKAVVLRNTAPQQVSLVSWKGCLQCGAAGLGVQMAVIRPDCAVPRCAVGAAHDAMQCCSLNLPHPPFQPCFKAHALLVGPGLPRPAARPTACGGGQAPLGSDM